MSSSRPSRVSAFNLGELNNNKICCDFTPDERFFATIGAVNSCINIWTLSNLSRHYIVPVKGSYIHTFKFSKSNHYEMFVLTCDAKVKVFYLEKSRAVQIREIVSTHESFISDLAFVGLSSFIVTVGGDKSLNVWDYWMRTKKGPGAKQHFIGHACPIYTTASSKSGKVYTAGGSEGIFCWKFLGDCTNDFGPQNSWGTVEVCKI